MYNPLHSFIDIINQFNNEFNYITLYDLILYDRSVLFGGENGAQEYWSDAQIL